MIRINLLPAEMRKRKSSEFNPEQLLILVGIILIALGAGSWAWIKYDRIPKAEDELADITKKFNEAKRIATQVEAKEREIKRFQDKVDTLSDLIGRKAYWAEALNDLASLVAGDRWFAGDERVDLQIACTELAMQETAGGRGGRHAKKSGGVVNWNINMTFQLVGTDYDQRGEYIKAFYSGLRDSRFWQAYSLEPDPERFYRKDQFKLHEDLGGLVELTQRLTPQRVHEIKVADLGTAAGKRPGSTTTEPPTKVDAVAGEER